MHARDPCNNCFEGWGAFHNLPVHAYTERGFICAAYHVRMASVCALLQDKMLTRVETARKEMQHIGDFDYGEVPSLRVSTALCEAYARHLPA